MSSRAKQRADRIRSEVPIIRVLADYGYHVNPDGEDREQQFSCDLHGSGQDRKPSARVYPSTNSWYCFGCGQTRDAIQTCRAKEGKDFWAAIQALETRYRLPPLPWEEDIAPATVSDIVREHLNADFSFEEQKNRVLRFLQNATDERETPLAQLLTWWETFDQIVYEVESMACTEQQGSARCEHLLGHCLSQMTKQGHP